MYSFLHHPNLSKTEHFVLQVILLTLLSCYKLNRCYIKLSLVNILEMVFVFIEILFKMLLFKGVYSFTLSTVYVYIYLSSKPVVLLNIFVEMKDFLMNRKFILLIN